ncbi:MAG: DM13 domain-containing protein [Iphinoe sp. HA4291-MV1]|jgi:hypothetical protein|nr:DM13 domain-containing protein [Iphinoe sp. HA4291-MV1]
MRLKYLLLVSIVALLTVSCTREISSKQPAKQPDIQTSTATVTTNITQSGTFKAGEHPTQGKVRVVNDNGKRYLEFDQSFKTDSGPDLFVILYRSETPPVSGIKEKDYVSIARLQKTSGTQRYRVPENVKLANFKSVAVWCRKFNATFGYANLSV